MDEAMERQLRIAERLGVATEAKTGMDEAMERQVEALKNEPDLYKYAKNPVVQKLAREMNMPIQSIALTFRNHYLT